MVFDTWLLGWIHQRGSPAQLMLAVIHLSLVVTHIISIQRSVDGASHKAPPSFHDWKALSSQVHRKERQARDVWRCVMTRNQPSVAASFFFFFNLFFGCTESSLIREGLLWLQQSRATLSLWCTGFLLQRFLLFWSTRREKCLSTCLL